MGRFTTNCPPPRSDSVLLVDDDPLWLRAQRRWLHLAGFSVETCAAPHDALELMRKFSWPVVVADWCMPQLDGLNFVSQASAVSPNSVFVVVSGEEALDLGQQSPRNANLVSYVRKTDGSEELEDAVRAAFEVYARRVTATRQTASRLLLIEDDADDRLLIETFLRDSDHQITWVHCVEAALMLLRHESFDTALVDLQLPDARGVDVVRRVRRAAPTTPIVCMTGNVDEVIADQALALGAQEFLHKDALEQRNLVRALRHAGLRKQGERELQFLARHDSLTGLHNALDFRQHLRAVLAKNRGRSSTCALLFIDLDGFKAVNDHWGHSVGDLVLLGAAEVLMDCVRDGDMVARMGGDEFCVLLDPMDLEGAHAAARRIVHQLTTTNLTSEVAPGLVNASIGLALAPNDAVEAQALIDAADAAMYAAKREAPGHVRRASCEVKSREGQSREDPATPPSAQDSESEKRPA